MKLWRLTLVLTGLLGMAGGGVWRGWVEGSRRHEKNSPMVWWWWFLRITPRPPLAFASPIALGFAWSPRAARDLPTCSST